MGKAQSRNEYLQGMGSKPHLKVGGKKDWQKGLRSKEWGSTIREGKSFGAQEGKACALKKGPATVCWGGGRTAIAVFATATRGKNRIFRGVKKKKKKGVGSGRKKRGLAVNSHQDVSSTCSGIKQNG